jgi:rSAM/selenodomain-associated transferase 1
MAKTPQAGRSKTRLCPPLLAAQAAQISAAFLSDTVDNIDLASRFAPIEVYAAYAPRGSEPALRAHVSPRTRLLLADGSAPMPQGVDGFGRCLLQAMEGMLGDGNTAACVLSSDCPTLPTRLLIEAARILLAPGERGVLGASRDGGYYLLGMKTAHAELFKNIAWSTSSVADETRDRAHQIGLELCELDIWYDVDDAASLACLLEERTGYSAPRTAEAIERLGLRHHVRIENELSEPL